MQRRKSLYDPTFRAHLVPMNRHDTSPFLARVTDALPTLHPSERKLADLVLNFPGEMGGYTATEIAELAGVSNATVSRFVRRIGYASFEEARRAVRDEQAAGAALMRLTSQAEDGSGPVARHLEMSRRNLDATYDGLEDAVVDGLAQAMIAAPRVWFLGFRAGQGFAQYLGWQASQVLPDVTVLPRAGETLAESLASLTKRDVVILVALRRMPRLVSAAAHAIRRTGAQLALVQDRSGEDLGEAQWRLACATAAAGPLMNHVGVMAICNLLVARTIELSGAAGRSRMASIEAGHRDLGEL